MFGKIKSKIIGIYRNFRNKTRYKKFVSEIEKDKKEFGLNNKRRNEEIIVSLTSFPARFAKLHLVIESILRQTMKPDKIILYFDDDIDDLKELPENIKSLKKYGVKIEKREGGIKPHKKYYYAIKEHPESIIITIDDDILYPKNLIEELYRVHKKFPNSVVATRSHKILFNVDGSIKKYNDWDWVSNLEGVPSLQLMATGCGGVLYPAHCMDDKVLDMQLLLKLSPNADDLWLKVMQILHHTPVVNCNQNVRKKRVVVDGSQDETLNSSNVYKNVNDIYMRNLMDYFNLKMKDFMEENI
ncbi:MAG: glycosyltransferase [Candidatus Gastranaerophilaceae bacterium]